MTRITDIIKEGFQKLTTTGKDGSNHGLKQPALRQTIALKAPFLGRLMSLSEVPDETFSQKILGDGFAIDPFEGQVFSPVDGKVINVFRTGHAVGIETKEGIEILIHVGIDTVKLNGEGFRTLVKVGQEVEAGDALIEFDLDHVRAYAKSTISPVVITNMDKIKHLTRIDGSDPTRVGDEVLSLEV